MRSIFYRVILNPTVTIVSLLLFSAVSLSTVAAALPFNRDMVDVQPKTGTVVRGRPEGTVPLGSLKSHLVSKEATSGLVNPKQDEPRSATNGKRLFAINCSPCHGDISRKSWSMGPVGLKGLPGPDLSQRSDLTDGRIFATIHFGGMALMPAVGFKLSPAETWDIVNYVRKVRKDKGK